MSEEEKLTIKDELEELGVRYGYFNGFYDKLRRKKELPPKDMMPEEQYGKIIDYLIGQKVLSENSEIQPDNMKVFDARKGLEDMLDSLEPRKFPKSNGGIAPCRSSGFGPISNGGMAPCRYNDGDL